MAFEADWLEREERYRRRVVKLLALGFVLAGAAIGTVAILRGRAARQASVAAAAAARAAREAEAQRVRDAFVADSTAAADRNNGFTNRHGATLVSGTPLIQIPLPVGTAVATHVQTLWPEYARVLDPQATPEQISEWYRKYYVDVMNDGPLRPSAILFPEIEQKGTKLFMERASFGQIASAQITVGMRVPAPPDTTEMMESFQPAAAPAADAPATAATAPAATAPAATAPAATAPPAAAPAATAVADTPPAATPPPVTPPAVEPPVDPPAEPPVEPAPPDSAANGPPP